MISRSFFAVGALLWILPAGAQTAPASLQGQVVDLKTGAPVRFATVALAGPFAERELIPPRQLRRVKITQITADEQGRFTFPEIAAGNYVLRGLREGYEPTIYRPSANPRELLPVREGQAVNGIALKMPPCGVIAGKVVNESGEPLQNVELVALRYYYGAWLWHPPVAPGVPLRSYTNDLGESGLRISPTAPTSSGRPRRGRRRSKETARRSSIRVFYTRTR